MPAPVVIRRAGARPSLLAQAWALHDAAQKTEAKAAKAAEPKLARPKDDLVRSEPYLRLVAAGACEHCGVSGYSQAAHLPPDGKGIKVSDLDTFSLCTVHRDAGGDLVEGCHKRFDHYELFPREAAIGVARKWIRKTQRRVLATGKWPKNVPVPAWLEKSNAKAKPQDEAAAPRSAVPDPRRDRKPPGDDARRGAAAGGRNARGPAKRAGRDRK
jgi:hypothetical protein